MRGEHGGEGYGRDDASRSGSSILAHERRREIANNVILVALFVVFAAGAAYCSSAGDDRIRGPSQE
jgi:hypothetical protein